MLDLCQVAQPLTRFVKKTIINRIIENSLPPIIFHCIVIVPFNLAVLSEVPVPFSVGMHDYT